MKILLVNICKFHGQKFLIKIHDLLVSLAEMQVTDGMASNTWVAGRLQANGW